MIEEKHFIIQKKKKSLRGVGYREGGDNHGNKVFQQESEDWAQGTFLEVDERFSSTGSIRIEKSTNIFVAQPIRIKINKCPLKLISARKEAWHQRETAFLQLHTEVF